MRPSLGLLLLLQTAAPAFAQSPDDPPLLPPTQVRSIGNEVSGSRALRTVHSLSVHHRMRVSEGFRAAAEEIRQRLAGYGLAEVEMISLPADGEIFYGTQRSRPAWNATFGELWEQRQEDGSWRDSVRVASWADQPISLAQDSVSGRAQTELVDIGAGASQADYQGKDVRGKLVLTSSQPEAVADLAVGRHGAAGIVSFAPNQRTAWSGQDQSLVRWGHLDTFGAHPTFAFMISLAQARLWQQRLQAGEPVRLRAQVEAGRSAGSYLIPTGVIPGRRRDQEIVYSCHLDHPSPGANDNASGCAGILEVARTLHRLIASGALPQPERTIRFIWPAEIEGTIALLNARPEFQTRTMATIHLDMIGGDHAVTGSILKVEGSPPSLPSFVSDVGFAFADYVNVQSLAFADTGEAAMPLIDPQGSPRALQAQIGGFSEGSDHQVWAEGSWRIPVIYIADWPDRYIHTQRDVPGNLDPTKMRRAIFVAASSGYFLAGLDRAAAQRLRPILGEDLGGTRRTANRRARQLDQAGRIDSGLALRAQADLFRQAIERSLDPYDSPPTSPGRAPQTGSTGTSLGQVYHRIQRSGPMSGFGYSWLDDQLARRGLPRPRLLLRKPDFPGISFGYEGLNLVDGQRSVDDIRAALAVTVGDAPLEEVEEYLATLTRLGVLEASHR